MASGSTPLDGRVRWLPPHEATMSVSYPAPAAPAFPTARLRTPSASTAESLVFVAFILQVIVSAFILGGLTYLFVYSALYPYANAWIAILSGALTFVVVGALLYIGYRLSYRKITAGHYQEAQTPTLLLGILTLFLGIIPGILYLVGYVKLGDAVREQQAPGYPAMAPMVSPQVACKGCGRVHPAGYFPFCPNCGQKMGA